MQARYIILPLLFAAAANLCAQEVADTTDMFFGHVALGEATVTGVAGRTRLKDSPTPVTLVSAKDLRQTSATNIVATLAAQPGLSAITTGNGIAKPVIRGLGYNRIVTLADGVRQEGQQWGDEHGVELDGSSVHSIEILKGPASLMYGSDAMAGVVIFHPAPLRPEGTMGGSLSSEYQTNSGLFDYSLNFAGNRRGFVWDARWSQKLAHAYKNKVDGYVPGSQFQEQAFKTLLGLDKGWGHSHLTLGYYHLKPGIIEGEREADTGELEAPDGWRGKSYGISLPFQHVRHYKAVWDTDLRLAHGSLKAILGYQHNRRQEYEEKADECELDFLLHTLTSDVRYQMAELAGWRLTGGLGGMWQRSLNQGEEYLIPAYSLFDIGAYVTGSKRLGDFVLSGGVRYDRRELHSHALEDEGKMRFEDFHRHMGGLTGSLGAVWQAQKNLNVRLNVAHGFRAPNMAELGSNGVHEGTARYEVGNHALRPERSWQADLGADYVDRYVSLQAALFVNHIDNYIYLRKASFTLPQAGEHAVYDYTSGDARLWGFEAGVDFHPIHSLHFQNTFSYVNAVQRHQPAEAKYLPMTPAPRWTSELKWEILHNAASLTRRTGLNHAFVAAHAECNLRQEHFLAAGGTETATPSYTLLGLSAGTDLLWCGRKVAEIFVCADNLTDRAYQPHLSRLKYMDVNSVTGCRGICNPGRNFTVKLTVPF